jgi:putative transcriptional regulator
MAIRIHLGRLLGERKMKMAELSRMTGVSKNALSNLYYEKVTGIQFDTLEKICEALGCTVGELIEYVPDKKTQGEIRRQEP